MNEIISRLVDPDDRSVLELVGEKDKKYVFKQIYVTQKDDQVYCVVRPITKISGISPDEAWVMQANSDNTLTIIENKQISNSVFAQYYQAIDSGKTEKGSVLKDEGLYTDPSSKSFSKFTELKLQADFKPIQKLDQAFHAVKGQDFACQSVKEYLFSVLHRFCSKGVAGCILFAGAPSTGKTMMGELIAQSLQRPFLRLDMSEYAHRESFIDLIGVNPCYKEAAQGVLTSFVNEHPVSVILLDEIEKAHENVMRIFLQVFDRGVLQDAFSKETIRFHNVLFILTTNVCRNLYDQSIIQYNFSQIPQSKIVDALKKEINPLTEKPFFEESLISRLTLGKIILLNKLRPETIDSILLEEIEKQKKAYQDRYKINFQIEDHQLSKTIILSAGEGADLRNLLGKTRSFFEKTMERMIEFEKEKAFSAGISQIVWNLDEKQFSPDVRKLYKGENQYRILLYADKSVEAIAQTLSSEKIEWIFDQNKGDKARIADMDLSAAIIQVDHTEKECRDLFLKIVKEETIPCYVFSRGSFAQSAFLFYTDHGATGIYSPKINSTSLKNWMQEIVQSVDLSFIVQSLFRSKQEIHYEENYQMDSRKGVFRVEFDRVQILSSISGEEDFQFVNGREIPHVTFEEIIGAEDAKNELKKVLDYLKNARAYRRLGWRIPRGILLDGAPGTGKTMLAKALANQAQLPFIQKNAGEFLHKWAGEGPKRVRELFRTARKYAPSIIFIDEFDIIARNRNSLGEGSEHLHEITNAFLSEMDGFLDYDQPVYVIAATNFSTQKEKTRLDEAFLRRFDAKIHIPLPNASERALFLNQMVQKYHLEAISENEIQNIADRSDEWNLADLSLVVQNALRKASEHGNVQSISDLDLDEAFESFRYGSAQAESIEQLTKVAYHEAGHTLVAYLVGEIPDYVTILSRGDYGKYMRIGQEDKMTFSRRDCLNRICISLSGRAAECLIDPNEGINTGSRLDLSRATSVAMDMIWKCGMGESLISYETLPNPLSDPFIREKVNRILNDQYQRAMHLLAENKSTFDKLVRQLLEKKQLNHFELKALFQENKCR